MNKAGHPLRHAQKPSDTNRRLITLLTGSEFR